MNQTDSPVGKLIFKSSHTFCLECIDQWLVSNPTCPLCKVKVNKKQASKDLLAYSIINDIRVSCINKGCPAKFKLDEIQFHIKVCQFDEKILTENLKKKLLQSQQKEKLNESDEGNQYFDFNNNNGSLKQRLYSKNPEIMKKALSSEDKKEEEVSEQDCLLALIDVKSNTMEENKKNLSHSLPTSAQTLENTSNISNLNNTVEEITRTNNSNPLLNNKRERSVSRNARNDNIEYNYADGYEEEFQRQIEQAIIESLMNNN